jgi:hypothetical protein
LKRWRGLAVIMIVATVGAVADARDMTSRVPTTAPLPVDQQDLRRLPGLGA